MKIKVFYYSATGNTRRVAQAIARGASSRAESVTTAGGPVEADLLFLGGAVYATHDHSINPKLAAFIGALSPDKVKSVALFCTGFADNAIPIMRDLLAARGIPIAKERFSCPGRFLFYNAGHPDAADLAAAEDFGRRQYLIAAR